MKGITELSAAPASRIARLRGPGLAILAALTVSGCANRQADQALYAQDAFIGMPVQTLLACAGVPDQRASVDNLDFFTYTSERVTTSPVSTGFGFGRRSPWSGWGWGWGLETGVYGDTETRSCKATFTLKDGKVTQLVYGGSTGEAAGRLPQCYTVVQNCLALIPQQSSQRLK